MGGNLGRAGFIWVRNKAIGYASFGGKGRGPGKIFLIKGGSEGGGLPFPTSVSTLVPPFFTYPGGGKIGSCHSARSEGEKNNH